MMRVPAIIQTEEKLLRPSHPVFVSQPTTFPFPTTPTTTAKMQFSVVLVSLFALAVSAAPAEIQKRSTTCGGTTYTTAQVNAASNAACTHVKAGTVAGSSTYPHRYNNYEGFDFDVTGPWYEFPIKTSGVYTGGSPGADRVVINASCGQAGQITHTGASGNNFVGCSGTS